MKLRLVWNHRYKFWAHKDSPSTGYVWSMGKWNDCWIEPNYSVDYMQDPPRAIVV